MEGSYYYNYILRKVPQRGRWAGGLRLVEKKNQKFTKIHTGILTVYCAKNYKFASCLCGFETCWAQEKENNRRNEEFHDLISYLIKEGCDFLHRSRPALGPTQPAVQ
jgi:hypothetical protein